MLVVWPWGERRSKDVTGGAVSAWQLPVEHSQEAFFLFIPVQFVAGSNTGLVCS